MIIALGILLATGCNMSNRDVAGPVITEPPPTTEDNSSEDPAVQALNCSRFNDYLVSVKKRAAHSEETPGGGVAYDAPTAADAGNNSSTSPAPISSVSEADFVKSVGSTFFVLRQDENDSTRSRLSSFGLKETGEVVPLGDASLAGSPIEFLVADKKVLAVTQARLENGTSGTWLHLVNTENMTVEDSARIEGTSYVAARLVGKTAHLVLKSWVNFAQQNEPSEKTLLPVAHWSDRSKTVGSCGTTFLPDEVLKNEDVSSHQFITVLSTSLSGSQLNLLGDSVASPGGNPIVSVNDSSLYVGITSYLNESSEIFKFKLSEGQTFFKAKGTVPGQLETSLGGYNSQFSMDEHKGILRVATTSGHLSRGGESTAKSSLYLLSEQQGALKMVGQLENLHSGEAIYGVRFVGDRGYVVTFKKIDPLFVIDLSDPTTPRLVGQLEVPGFSTYLTAIDDKTILTIGKDADDQGTFAWYLGLKLSLFNVADPANPRLIQSVTIGKRGTDSEALTDHRAFNYFADRHLLALPVDLVTTAPDASNTRWRSVGSVDHSEEEVWQIDVEKGFSQTGTIRHDDIFKDSKISTKLRRALEVGGQLVTLSNAGVKVHDFANPSTDLSSLAVPLSVMPLGEINE